VSEQPIEILSFGCRLNSFESEAMKSAAKEAGLSGAVIVNTCAVTSEAERQARQAIRKLKRERPGLRIIVTGCAAQVSSSKFTDMPEVDRVVGNADKLDPRVLAGESRLHLTAFQDVSELAPHLVEGFEGRARAFVQIQQGCDHRCAFCVIPLARGPSRSIAPERIVAQGRKLAQAGWKEMALTGVDISSWGRDLKGKPSLGHLVRLLLDEIPDLSRLRFSSLDPAEIDQELLDALTSQPRLMPHLHLSIQAGSDGVLKRMARRHRRGDLLLLAERLRQARPGLALGADLIAGFPGESEAEQAETLALIDEMDLTHLHVFPFSARPGTAAFRMKRLSGEVVKERAAALRLAGETRLLGRMKARLGEMASVLVETNGQGYSEDYLPVSVKGSAAAAGDIVQVRLTAMENERLAGELAA
jgi:threonylcarbamoyladenosine tRNA methylthiotransferase MtaB